MPKSSNASKQLQNRRILVVCSAKKAPELTAGLEMMGGSVLPFPVIEAKDIEDKHLMDKAISDLAKYNWIILTSAHGVDFFMKRLIKCRGSSNRIPAICAIGPATAAGLKKFGQKAALVPKQYVAEGVLQALIDYHGGIQNLAGLNILLPGAKVARDFLPKALAEAGANVEVVPCYQTVRAKLDSTVVQKIQEKIPDLLVFTSSSTINNLVDMLGADAGRKMLMESTVAVIGPITASTAAVYGKRADIIPRENTISSLLEAIREHYSSH